MHINELKIRATDETNKHEQGSFLHNKEQIMVKEYSSEINSQ